MFLKSRGRQPEPLPENQCFRRSEDDAHWQSPEDGRCTGNYRGRESSRCMRNAAKPPLTKPLMHAAFLGWFFLLFPDNPVP